MRLALTGDHHRFFEHHHYICFDTLYSPEEIEMLRGACEKTVEKRLRGNPSTSHTLFLQGRDLWKETPLLEKGAFRTPLGTTASLLFRKPVIRLAFDQLCGSYGETPVQLSHMSCIRPLLGGALIRLSPPSTPLAPLPEKPGDVLFFSHRFLFPWQLLLAEPQTLFLLIAFAPEAAQYVLDDRDPHTHKLKKRGYVFGDALQDEEHPLLYKQ